METNMTARTGSGTITMENAVMDAATLNEMLGETEEMEPVEYELIFSKYPTVDSLAFKQKTMHDYVGWQRDMIRIYTDSFLADVSALPEVDVYCIDHSFKETKRGKGKLKATFVLKVNGEEVSRHRLVLNKLRTENENRIIDAHIYLLEMALIGNKADHKDENGPLHKFCSILSHNDLLKSTTELIDAILVMKTDGTIVENQKVDEAE